MKNPKHYILQKAADFPQVSAGRRRVAARPEMPLPWWRRILGQREADYSFPHGHLSEVFDFDGEPITVAVEEAASTLVMHPRLRIQEVINVDRAFAILQPAYDRQLIEIRKRVNEIFKRAFGLSSSSEMLDALATAETAERAMLATDGGLAALPTLIDQELGLLIDWRMELDPKSQRWLQLLRSQLASKHLLEFNKESRTAQFRLTYTAKITGVRPAAWAAAQHRSKHAQASEDGVLAELQAIHSIVQQILAPAFSVFCGPEKLWEHPHFWSAIRHAFSQVVAPRLVKEFGYCVEFDDFSRERTPAEEEALRLLEDPTRLQREFLSAERAYQEVLALRDEATIDFAHRPDAPELATLQASLEAARRRVEAAQRHMERVSTGEATALGTIKADLWAQTFTRFFSSLKLGEVPSHILQLPPPSSGT